MKARQKWRAFLLFIFWAICFLISNSSPSSLEPSIHSFVKTAALIAIVSACAAPSPEQRMATAAENAQISKGVANDMAGPAVAAIGECLRQIESGAFAEANFLNAGFAKNNRFSGGDYVIDVGPVVTKGLSSRRQIFGVTIGPRAAVNFRPGCRFLLPSRGSAQLVIAAAASKAASANGYEVTVNNGGLFMFEKAGNKIRMAITTTFSNGNIWVQAQISPSKS